MQVVVLGAAGEMGRVAAAHLAANEAISDLVLADLDGERAEAVRRRVGAGAGRLRSTACDVLDGRAIRQLLDGADLVVNCAGPFFRLGIPSVRAAIDTSTTYLDICDDPEPTIEMLRLDEAAREADVAVVVGMGASPGVSNLLARRAASRLDTVHDCYTGWSLDDSADPSPAPAVPSGATTGPFDDALRRPDGSPSGAVVHFMEQIHGEVAVVEDGELVRRPPLAAVDLDYPGVGRGTAYVVGHPEPVTLHRSLGVTGHSCNLVLVDDGATVAFLRGLQRDLDGGRLTLDEAAGLMLSPPPARVAEAALVGAGLGTGGPLPRLFAWLRGTVSGEPAVATCHVTTMPAGMAGATSIPAALAAGQLLERRPAPGVHPPEAVIDPDRLLTELIPSCAARVTDLAALAPVHVAALT